MFRFNIITILTYWLFGASQISLCAHWRYDVKQTAPLEQPVNTASSASLSKRRDDFNFHTRTSESIIWGVTQVNFFYASCVMIGKLRVLSSKVTWKTHRLNKYNSLNFVKETCGSRMQLCVCQIDRFGRTSSRVLWNGGTITLLKLRWNSVAGVEYSV